MMRSNTLFQQHPPTPPTGVEGQHGLPHLAQYNVGPRYSFDSVGYGSPGAAAQEGIPLYTSRTDSHQGEEYGLGIRYVRAHVFPSRDNADQNIERLWSCDGLLPQRAVQ